MYITKIFINIKIYYHLVKHLIKIIIQFQLFIRIINHIILNQNLILNIYIIHLNFL